MNCSKRRSYVATWPPIKWKGKIGSLSAIKSIAATEEITRVIGEKNSHVLHDIRRIGPKLGEVCEAYDYLFFGHA